VAAAHTHEEEALGRAYDARLMRRLLQYLQPYRGRVALAIALLLAGATIELAGPLLTRYALDHAVPAGDTSLLLLISLAFLGALVLAFITEAAQTLITTWLGQHIMRDLRAQIFSHLQRLPLPYYDRNPVGRTMTRVTSDVEVLNDLFGAGVVTIFGDIFTLLLILTAMLLMDWQLTLVTMAVMPFVFGVAAVFRTRIREAYRQVRVRLARINAFLQEHISGVAVVQLFGREAAATQQFHDVNRDYLRAHLRSIRYYALFFPVIEVLTSIAIAAIIVYGGVEILAGTVTVGTLAAFLQFARRFFRPIQDLSEKYNMLQGAMASSERIFALLDTEPEQTRAATQQLPTPGRGEVEFRNVWFAYVRRDDSPGADWEWVIRDLSFRVRPGERVAIVGHTGAGKTSLISLLLRFYEPQRGEILFDGVPIRDVAADVLRDRIGLVLQDIFLFSRSVGYNIRLGRSDIDDARMAEAARRVGADDVVQRLPRGWDEPLGERGASLSVGERQLLSFARALAFDPQVLILDEATSSVDSTLEQRIEDALAILMRGRTALVIAHRLSTVQNADRILVMHHGELREEGTHRTLLRRGGLYARLYELQFETGQTPAGPRHGLDLAAPVSDQPAAEPAGEAS
jgi:ATP-binding cassette, subfamily B, multidrug efflux pump